MRVRVCVNGEEAGIQLERVIGLVLSPSFSVVEV